MSETEAAAAIVRHMLQPVQPILDQPGLTDFHINGVGHGMAFVDIGRGMTQTTLGYDLRDLEDLATYAAAITRQNVSERTPLVSTKFPDGERVNIIMPPAVEDGRIIFSLRKPKAVTDTPDDLERSGTFNGAKHAVAYSSPNEEEMMRRYRAGETKALLTLAVQSRLNIVFSGAVGSGKTHVQRTMCNCISDDNRIVTIEDTREMIDMSQPNVVNLLYSKGEQSVAKVKAVDLTEAAMRMGMDWLINQELRDGSGAIAFMDAVGSGHKAMTTTHADSCADTRIRICSLVKKHETAVHTDSREIMASLYRGIDLIVHCKKEKDPVTGNWRRFIDEVLYDPEMKEAFRNIPSPDYKVKAA